jgi:hypothetical protein
VDWLPSVACGLISVVLLWRWRSLGGRRPPLRFWLGLALQVPIWASAHYAFAESWVLASWGLWLALDGLAESCGRPSLIAEQPEAAVWALVISTFGWAGIDAVNGYFPVWALLGFSFNPLAREVAIGLLGAGVVPTVLAVASLLAANSPGSGAGRLLTLAAGAATWAAFDSLWSQVGPAERLYVGFSSWPAVLPAILAVCAFCLVAVYNAAANFLDKPRFDPFSRTE